jgi:hypothetical protein
MEFPDWTPSSLKELYTGFFEDWTQSSLKEHYPGLFKDSLLDNLFEGSLFDDNELENFPRLGPRRDGRERDLLIRLATTGTGINYNMEHAWKKIEELQRSEQTPVYLYFHAVCALTKDPSERMTRDKEEKHYQKIAKKARELVQVCEGSMVDDAVYMYYPEPTAQTIVNTLNPERTTRTSRITYLDTGLKPDGDKSATDFTLTTFPQYPTLSEILRKVSIRADALSEDARSRPRYTESPGGKSSRRDIFIRKMAKAFTYECGENVLPALHKFCSVCLEEELDYQTVREKFRQR